MYNNILSLAAVGIENESGGKWDEIHGVHAVRLSGRTYHKFHSSEGRGGLQYFIFCAEEMARNHALQFNLDDNILAEIFKLLNGINSFCQECRQIGTLADITAYAHEYDRDIYASIEEMTTDINVVTHHLDVSAIVSDKLDGQHVLQIHKKNSTKTTSIHAGDSQYEPLSYPILFPYGENGWGTDSGRIHNISFDKYLISRMLKPESGMGYFGAPTDDNEGSYFPSNRFQLWSQIGQVYHVDQVSRLIDFNIRAAGYHQRVMAQAGLDHGLSHDNDNDEEDDFIVGDDELDDEGINKLHQKFADGSKKSFLSDQFHGGQRTMRKKAVNALTIVSEFGQSHFFLTVTFNQCWKEVQEALPPGQTIYENPHIACLVFKHR